MSQRVSSEMRPLRLSGFFTRESMRQAASMVTWFWVAGLLLLIPFRWVQGIQTTLTSADSPVAGITDAAARGMLAMTVAACLVGLVTRYTDHLYQGGLGSLFAVLWGAGLLAVFAAYRSVLPLILGHFLFDALVPGNRLLPTDWLSYLAVFALVLGGAFALSYLRFGRRR